MLKPRIAPLVASLAAAVLLLAACGGGEDETPPSNPLDDSDATTATATPQVGATGTPADGDGTPAPAEGIDAESATGRAIAFMAQALGIPETELQPVETTEVEWPNSCLGVDRPGQLCAEVVTPGYEVVLEDALGGRHVVHTDMRANLAWDGQERAEGTVTGIDAAANRITVELAEGGEQTFAWSNGTVWATDAMAPGIAGVEIGDPVVVSSDPAPVEDQPRVLAWLGIAPPSE